MQPDSFELELQAAFDALSIDDISIYEFGIEQISRAKDRYIYLVESWGIDEISERLLIDKIIRCQTMSDLHEVNQSFFHFAPPPSFLRNVAKINKEGKQYWANAFIEYRKRNGTF
jgi:hypothetical protein